MPTKLKFPLLLVTLVLLCSSEPAWAYAPQTQAPPGFRLLAEAPGVRLYQKNYANGVPDYVQVIDLSRGAQLIPLYGGIAEDRPQAGVYGGADPRFYSKSLQKYWQGLQEQHPDAFCVSNGQFFFMPEYPTRLPFPLRVDGQVISDGYDSKGFPDQKLLLLLWPGKADIVKLDKETLYGTTAPHAIAGLSEDARKSPTKHVGRTFVGIDDLDGDGQAEVVLLFSTRSARQKDAAEVLRSFGADQVMMFDGGGSAQLTCQGVAYVASERLLPQALGVIAAPAYISPYTEPPPGHPAAPISAQPTEAEPISAQAAAPGSEEPPLSPPPSQASLYASPASLDLEDVIWVPAAILPLSLALLLAVDRVHRGAH